MIDLDPKAWKTISAKYKIKDNGLDKALTSYDKLADDAHDECLKTIGVIGQLAAALKKAKEVAAAPDVVKYLGGLSSAADKEKADVLKAKQAAATAQAAADKAKAAAAKVEADEKKKQADADQEDAADEKQEGGFKALTLQMLQKVKGAKPDAPFQYLLCDAKPFPYVMISKQITANHRKMLEKLSGGSKRFLKPGAITFEDGHYCFEAEKDLPGAARRIQGFFKNLTGKKFPVMFGTQKASDEEDAGAEGGAAAGAAGAQAGATGAAAAGAKSPFSIGASVGQGGKNKPQDVQAVQVALNAKMKAGLTVDGKMGPKTIAAIKAFQQTLGKFKPDGLVEVGRGTARALASNAPAGPPPAPPKPVDPPKLGRGVLDKAPAVWHSTRGILQTNIGELKKAVRSEYATEHPTLVQDIEENLKKLDGILEKLDTKLADSLAKANAAKTPAAKQAALAECKGQVAKHIMYVKQEPLIAHIDSNPFGVATNCKKILTDCLTHVAEAISVKAA